ncbi:NUDIX domain-containing protein [Bacillus carboniphilus]|uniref:NUDIX domain-containing protein n=1 Tax=Bacillus carboniphilus TaxID=86663 RepID=A0ABY9JU43_9BACI|nr:NUDIX domain-containing protein [Bacillus carboniphilus]WLR42263.1 NUDIX domain-containing protein [Bacillus carboniphilus]
MNFNKLIKMPENKSYNSIREREAVRAIIFSQKHILLVHSNRGDYKFPGGGVENKESHSEALIREVREETGYKNCIVKNKVGTVIEQNMDENETSKLFQMNSHYYLCGLNDREYTSQKLETYESLLGLTPKWVSIEEAIRQNEILYGQFENNSWLERENYVLNLLKGLI